MKPQLKENYKREALLERVEQSDDVENRVLAFSFSSETPVERWDWVEILDHSPEAIDLSRLKNKANVLFNHNPDIIIGVIEDVWVDTAERKLRGKIKFSRSPEGEVNFQDVLDGIRNNVSISYRVDELRLESEEEGIPTYRITKWMPYEVSIVSIPADITVGYKRNKEEENVTMDKLNNTSENTMNVNIQTVDPKDEEKRVAEIKALGEKHKLPYDWAIKENISVAAYRGFVLEQIGSSKPLYTDDISLTEKEKKQYSISRAILSLVNGENSFEREISEEYAKKMEIRLEPGKLVIPHSVLSRDLLTTASGGGAEWKSMEWLGGEFIDVLRNKMVTQKLGVQTLTGLKGDVYIPKLSAGSTWGWKAENGSFAESTPTTAQLVLSPKEGGTFVDYSKKLLVQSNPSVDQLIINDFTQIAALGLDKAILKGSGASGQPRGILNTTGVNSVTSASLTYAGAVSFVQKVMEANADSERCAFVLSPAGWAALKSRQKASNYPSYLIDEDDRMVGYPVYATGQLGNSEIIFGDFGFVILALWSGVEITVDPYTQASSNLIRVLVSQMADVGVKVPAAFSVGTDLS